MLPLMAKGRALGWILVALAALGCASLAVERVWLAAVQPLWFDEAWSLAVATAPDWASVVREALSDSNAPLYYLFLHGWTALAGPSDLALRLPGLVALLAAGAIPLLTRIEGRRTWAALVFAWWGVDIFLAGRGYGLLLALSLAQTVVFAGLIRAPTMKRAAGWAALGTLAILTHYYALILTGLQALTFLILHRKDALRVWPVSLLFAPALGWLAWHWPRLQAFAAPQNAWHAALGPLDALAMAAVGLNPSAPLVGAAAGAVLVALALRRFGRPDALAVAALVSLGALVVTLASGMLRPTLTARYLIPTVPGLLLGLVLLARATPRPRLAQCALALLWIGTAVRPAAFAAGLRSQAPYGFETASRTLIAHGISDVVFVWDHEVTALMAPATLERIGSVFFRRAQAPVRVIPLTVRPRDDVNAASLAAATGPRPGIIWIYNRAGRTAAAAHPPAIPARDARWTCERIGDETVGSLACWRALH